MEGRQTAVEVKAQTDRERYPGQTNSYLSQYLPCSLGNAFQQKEELIRFVWGKDIKQQYRKRMQGLARGLTREIHEEVKANPMENKYKCAGRHGISGSQEGKECSQRDTV